VDLVAGGEHDLGDGVFDVLALHLLDEGHEGHEEALDLELLGESEDAEVGEDDF